AKVYLDHWNALAEAGNDTPPSLLQDDNKVKSTNVTNTSVSVWFARTTGEPEMKAVADLIAKAQQGVLFLMFEPGGSPIENAILELKAKRPDLFVKGVISTMDKNDQTKGSVTLVQRGNTKIPPLEVIEPTGIDSGV